MIPLLLLLAPASAAGLPDDGAAWETLSTSPVRVECTTHDGAPWCRSFGLIGAPIDQVSQALRDMRGNADAFESVLSIRVISEDTLHIVLDYPSPLDDRDYVARYSHSTDGDVQRFSWVSEGQSAVPVPDGVVRLPNFAGEWELRPHAGGTAVRYTWHGEINGSFPAFGYSVARKKAGHEALKDLAQTQGARLSKLD